MDYLQMPWSIKQTIADLNVIRYIMIKRLRTVNLDGKAEQDVKELNFDFDKAVNALKEIQQYRQIGTLEECREAREKQKTKEVFTHTNNTDVKIGNVVFRKGTKTHKCLCGRLVMRGYKFCPECGQALDWTQEEVSQ